MGRAFGSDAEVIVFGSLIWRASGPDDCASAEPQTKMSKKQRQTVRRDFIATSFLVRIGQAFRADSQAGGIVHLAARQSVSMGSIETPLDLFTAWQHVTGSS
jgi:hypothetical protein